MEENRTLASKSETQDETLKVFKSDNRTLSKVVKDLKTQLLIFQDENSRLVAQKVQNSNRKS